MAPTIQRPPRQLPLPQPTCPTTPATSHIYASREVDTWVPGMPLSPPPSGLSTRVDPDEDQRAFRRQDRYRPIDDEEDVSRRRKSGSVSPVGSRREKVSEGSRGWGEVRGEAADHVSSSSSSIVVRSPPPPPKIIDSGLSTLPAPTRASSDDRSLSPDRYGPPRPPRSTRRVTEEARRVSPFPTTDRTSGSRELTEDVEPSSHSKRGINGAEPR